jgi:hypothetical protein
LEWSGKNEGFPILSLSLTRMLALMKLGVRNGSGDGGLAFEASTKLANHKDVSEDVKEGP